MKKPQQSITSLPQSPEDERRGRVLKYTVAMSVRLLCVVLCFFLHGWWLVVAVVGAVVLPYIAVVLANNVTTSRSPAPLRPGGLLPYQPPPNGPGGPR